MTDRLEAGYRAKLRWLLAKVRPRRLDFGVDLLVRRARALLSGLVAGCYATAALGVVTLTTDTTGPWPAVSWIRKVKSLSAGPPR